MRSRTGRMTVCARVLTLAFYLFRVMSSDNVRGQKQSCGTVILGLNTTYLKGDATHEFKVWYGEVLFVTKNDSRGQMVRSAPGIEHVNLSTELGFFEAQYTRLTQSSPTSSVRDVGISLFYSFIPISGTWTLLLKIDDKFISTTYSGEALFVQSAYKNDPVVQSYARGIAVDVLKNDSANLYTKWKTYCERRKSKNGTHATASAPIPKPTSPETRTTLVTEAVRATEMNALGGTANASSASKTGALVGGIISAVIVASGAVVAWKYRETLRSTFERVPTG